MYIQMLWILFVFVNLFGQMDSGCPDWTHGKIDDTGDYYYGLGQSDKSQEEANERARKEFAKMYESKVTSTSTLEQNESSSGFTEKYMKYSQMDTDVTLRGVGITSICNDSVHFWSLIKIKKNRFEAMLKEAADKDLVRHKEDIARALKQQKIKDDNRAREDSLRLVKQVKKHEQKQLERQNKLRRLEIRQTAKQDQRSYRLNRYRSFLSQEPSHHVISMTNGQILKSTHNISLGFVVDPFGINSLGYTYHIWLLESNLNLDFIGNKLDRQVLSLKMQILPSAGTYYKTTVAIGAVEYIGRISMTADKNLKPKYSPTVSGIITFPHLLQSHVSFYADSRMLILGINSYAFYDNFGDRFNILGQINYIDDEAFRNRFNEKFEFEVGL